MSRDDTLITGRLGEHGAAPYLFDSDQSPSYFVKVITVDGERVLWGTDLKRALTESVSKPKTGDVVGAMRTGRQAVTITERERDAQGRVISEVQRPAQRTRWVVEKVSFLAERAKLARRVRDEHLDARQAVRARPELVSTYLSLRGAEQIAERRIADPKDRDRFLALVREAMASSIERGEPLPAVRIREKSNSPERSVPPAPRTRRGDDRTR